MRDRSVTKVIRVVLLIIFIMSSLGPIPEIRADMLSLSSLPRIEYPQRVVVLKGLQLDPKEPKQFELIVEPQDDLNENALREASMRLVKYFLASLTVPQEDMWVNLSPYEKDRVIPDEFGQTLMGKDLLADDYLLKQLTASMIHPDTALGQEFWTKIYAKAKSLYKTSDIPVNTFNKVWIMPDRATVWERGQSVFVVERHLKVMLEEDYASLNKNIKREDFPKGGVSERNTHELGRQIMRDILIPALEREVNEGKAFARLREIYNAMILASWYKKRMKDSFLAQAYTDRKKIDGINASDAQTAEQTYARYLKTFKKGVFNFIREEPEALTGQMIARRYFSGGAVGINQADLAIINSPVSRLPAATRAQLPGDHAKRVRFNLNIPRDHAMIANKKQWVKDVLQGRDVRPDPLETLSLIQQESLTEQDIHQYAKEAGFSPLVLQKTLVEVSSLAPYLEKIASALYQQYGKDEDHTILFAGRDAENIYDAYQTMAKLNGWKVKAKLFPGSLKFWRDPQYPENAFFEQMGLTPDAFERKERFVLVDSGFQGTIGKTLLARLKERYRDVKDFPITSLMVKSEVSPANQILIERQEGLGVDLERLFPRAASTMTGKYALKKGDVLHLAATALQMLPRFHGAYLRYDAHRSNYVYEGNFSVPGDYANQIDDDKNMNADLVNPYAALLVQHRLIGLLSDQAMVSVLETLSSEDRKFLNDAFDTRTQEALSMIGPQELAINRRELLKRLVERGLPIALIADVMHYSSMDKGDAFEDMPPKLQELILSRLDASRSLSRNNFDQVWKAYGNPSVEQEEQRLKDTDSFIKQLIEEAQERNRSVFSTYRSVEGEKEEQAHRQGLASLLPDDPRAQFYELAVTDDSGEISFEIWTRDERLLEAVHQGVQEHQLMKFTRKALPVGEIKYQKDAQGRAQIEYVQSWIRPNNKPLPAELKGIETLLLRAFEVYWTAQKGGAILSKAGYHYFSKRLMHRNTISRINQLYLDQGYVLIQEGFRGWYWQKTMDVAMLSFASKDDFANRYMISGISREGMSPFPRLQKSVKEIIDHEAPDAIDALKNILNIRQWLDDNGQHDRPVIIWQNMRLGELYPLMTDKIKAALGINEVISSARDFRGWAKDPSTIPEAYKKARYLLVKFKVPSSMPDHTESIRSFNAFATHLNAFTMMIDNSERWISSAQGHVFLSALWFNREDYGKKVFDFYRPTAENLEVLKEPVIWSFLNTGRASPSWMDDRDAFIEDTGERVSVQGREYSAYELARGLYGEAIERAILESQATVLDKIKPYLEARDQAMGSAKGERSLRLSYAWIGADKLRQDPLLLNDIEAWGYLRFEDFMFNSHRVLLAYAHDGGKDQLVGAYSIMGDEQTEMGSGVVVNPEYRRKGVGTALMMEMIRRLKEEGKAKFMIHFATRKMNDEDLVVEASQALATRLKKLVQEDARKVDEDRWGIGSIFLNLRKIDRGALDEMQDDSAMQADNPGGIDMNADHLELSIKRDGQGVPLPASLQNWSNIRFSGLEPVIISIEPFDSKALFSYN